MTLLSLIQAVPTAFLGKALSEIASGYVAEKAKLLDAGRLRAFRDRGLRIDEALGMASPEIQAFLLNVTRRCPWLLEDITLDSVLAWASNGNPSLVSDLLSDPDLLSWGYGSWTEGVERLRLLAGEAVD